MIDHVSGPTSSGLIPVNSVDMKSGRLEFSQLLDDVRNLQTKQTSLSDKLSYMQNEHKALWGEIGSLRQKHARQQQIVSKLLQFLLHFISNNAQHPHDVAVEKASNEILTNQPYSVQHQQDPSQGQNHANASSLILSDETTSPNSLKRKQAMPSQNEEPNKRPAHQQPQAQAQPQPFGRQQSVTINELSDHDSQAWAHAATSSTPLIDLVPSPPPPPGHNVDDHHLPQQTKSTHVGNGDQRNPAFEPDFVLRPEQPASAAAYLAPPTDSTGIKTVTVDIQCYIDIL